MSETSFRVSIPKGAYGHDRGTTDMTAYLFLQQEDRNWSQAFIFGFQ